MPPIIDLTTSVLGYDQHQAFEYQPFATGLDTSVSPLIATAAQLARRLPDAVAATTAVLPTSTYSNGTDGVGATLTRSSNGALTTQDGVTLIEGDTLLVKNEASASRNGLYVVTDVGSGAAPWVLTRHAGADGAGDFIGHHVVLTGTTLKNTIWLAAGKALAVGINPIAYTRWHNQWRVTAVPTGAAFNAATGALIGPVTRAGVYVFGYQASSDSGATWSTPPVRVTLGIAPSTQVTRSGADLYLNVVTGRVSSRPNVTDADTAPLLHHKLGDQFLLYVHLHREGVILDKGELPAMEYGLKEFDDEGLLVLGGGDDASTEFGRIGTGEDTSYVMAVDLSAKSLARVLDEYEAPEGTHVLAIAEVRWEEDNETGIGPSTLRRSSQTFRVRIDRNVIPAPTAL